MMFHNEKHGSQKDDIDLAKTRIVRRLGNKAWWNDCKRERRLFGRWLCKEAETGNREWSPMRYVSQQEIDEWREWRRKLWEVEKLDFYDKYPEVMSSTGRYIRIYEPDYYRVEHRSKPSDLWEQNNSGGFPEHHRNWAVRTFEKYAFPEFIDIFLDHHVDKELKLMEKEENEYKEKEKIRIKNLNREEQERRKSWKAWERCCRTRGVTPDVETTAFFQALATGGIIK
jgi:hypothetical protein